MAVAVILAAGCQPKSENASSEATAANEVAEANKAGVRKFIEGMAKGDTSVVDSLVADNMVEHQMMPGMAPGPAGIKAMIAEWHSAFPDMEITIHDMAADGDKVWVYSTMSGTMTGPLMGRKPTGKSFKVDGFDLLRIENGKAVEHWGAMDNMEMMQQLGMSAPPSEKKGGAKSY